VDFRKTFSLIINGAVVTAPFILLLLPVDYFDTGDSICLSKVLAGIECYGCGMTRAVMHFVHFDFAGAWMFNKLSFLVVPMLFPLWVKSLLIVLNKPLPRFMVKWM